MTNKAMRYLELLREKELARATEKLTPESALRYAAQLDRIWNELDEHDRILVDENLASSKTKPEKGDE